MTCMICKTPESYLLPDLINSSAPEKPYCFDCHENRAIPRDVLIDLFEIAGCNWDKLVIYEKETLTVYSKKHQDYIPAHTWLINYKKKIRPKIVKQNKAEEKARKQKFEKPKEFINLNDEERKNLQLNYLDQNEEDEEDLSNLVTHLRLHIPVLTPTFQGYTPYWATSKLSNGDNTNGK